MTEKRPFQTRILDFLMGRTSHDIDQNEAGREDIKFNNKTVDKTMDKVMDTRDLVNETVTSLNGVLEQLAKDLGYEDKRKGKKAHAKTSGRSNKA